MKNIGITLLLIILLFWVISLVSGHTFIIYTSSKNDTKKTYSKDYIIGDTLSALQGINFTQGEWEAYLILDGEDSHALVPEIQKGNCYKTNDINILENMQKDWKVVVTGGDMSTVSSKLLLFKDGKIEFATGIVLDSPKEGLQNSQLGWAEAINEKVLSMYCKQFKRVYYPVIFL